MATIHFHTRSTEAFFEATEERALHTEVHILEIPGLGAHPDFPADRLSEAVSAAGLPAPGSLIDIQGTTFIVRRKTARPIEEGAAIQVTVEAEAIPAIIPGTYSAQLNTERTNLAYNRTEQAFNIPITTEHMGETKGALIDVMRPQLVVQRRYFVSANPQDIPNTITLGSALVFTKNYVGTVNGEADISAPWPSNILDPQPKQWLISRIHVTSFPNTAYFADVEFSYRDRSWDATVVHLDASGQPVEYAEEDPLADPPIPPPTEVRTVQLYPERNFHEITSVL